MASVVEVLLDFFVFAKCNVVDASCFGIKWNSTMQAALDASSDDYVLLTAEATQKNLLTQIVTLGFVCVSLCYWTTYFLITATENPETWIESETAVRALTLARPLLNISLGIWALLSFIWTTQNVHVFSDDVVFQTSVLQYIVLNMNPVTVLLQLFLVWTCITKASSLSNRASEAPTEAAQEGGSSTKCESS